MAGHSQFKNIMYRKGAQDAKKAKIFAKIAREITVASKTGLPDPQLNSRLRSALASAREANMPKDNIERALKKGIGEDGENQIFEEIRYEGFGVNGIAFIVESLTDNRNRTASEIRSVFSRHGGHLGESGSAAFLFEHIGFLRFPKTIGPFDLVFETVLAANADDLEDEEEAYTITCSVSEFHQVHEKLMHILGDPLEARLIWSPINLVEITEDVKESVLKVIDALEDNDDVQLVYTNADLT
jgi:YebC/PmpR family DNA-binding regulatory protein